MTDQDALALTIWGEARGEPIEGKIGVGNVIMNRAATHYRGATSVLEVCTAHAQFSAWTDEATQLGQELELQLAGHPDPALRLCDEIASALLAALLCDNTFGANHYYATTIAAPAWVEGATLLAQLGSQKFYNVA